MTVSRIIPNTSYTLDAGASFVSDAFLTDSLLGVMIQVVFASGTVNGTLTLEVSADKPKANTAPTNWVTVTAPQDSTLSVSGNSAPYVYNIEGLMGTWIRLRYVRSSGSGNSVVTFNGKGGL